MQTPLKTYLTVGELSRFVAGLPPDAAVVVVYDCGRSHGAYWTSAASDDRSGDLYTRGVLKGLSDALGLRMFPPEPEDSIAGA